MLLIIMIIMYTEHPTKVVQTYMYM